MSTFYAPLMILSEWSGEHDFTVGGVRYRSMAGRTGDGQMVVLKPREAVEGYEALIAAEHPQTILELGIYDGGSAALLAQLAEPAKMVVVDLRPDCPHLEAFLDDHDLRGVVVPYYGVDQANAEQLDEVMTAEFDGPIDLIIDDASHLFEPTRASFNRLFPHLRPGGLYVIEDWAWAHSKAVSPEEQRTTPLSAFVFELVVLAGRRPRMIAEVTINDFATTVRRGPAELHPERFDVAEQLGPVASDMISRLSG